METTSVFEILKLVLIVGIGLNFLTTIVSTLNDLYWKNENIPQGIIACLAFSWMPFLVFFAGFKHLVAWTARNLKSK